MATLQEITERIRAGLAAGNDFGRRLKFNLKEDGVILIDGTSVSNADDPADLTLTTSKADLEALGAGRLDPMSAVMSGRLRLSDTSLALKLQPQLQSLFAKLR